MIPFRFGTDREFARVRRSFLEAGFDDREMWSRLHYSDDIFKPYENGNIVPQNVSPAELLVGLFLRGAVADREQCRRLLPAGALEDYAALGLIRDAGDGRVKATVRIRPMFSLYVASDVWRSREDEAMPDDVVYPPDTPLTLEFLSYLPLVPCERYLEVCGGTGVAALIGAQRFARHAWSYDITERATEFARFNARLNGITNFTAGCGDAYAPAQGEKFDRIVAHPPYVPVLQHTWIFHSGGADGEQVTRKLIEGLPDHLAPGGRFYCRCLGSDRVDAPFENRIRGWLGDQHEDFDVFVAVKKTFSPASFFADSITRGTSTLKDYARWREVFKQLKIVRFLTAIVVIQRRSDSRAVFTERRHHGKHTSPAEVEWLMNFETMRVKGCEDLILKTRLKAAPAQLHVLHRIESGEWAIAQQKLQVDHPFSCIWEVAPLASYIIPRLSNPQTGAELLDSLKAEGSLAQSEDPARFARALAELASGGFILVEGYEPPAPEPRPETPPDPSEVQETSGSEPLS